MLWDITNHGDRLRSHRQSHGQTKKNSMNTLVRSAQHTMAFISNCSFNLDRETLICVLYCTIITFFRSGVTIWSKLPLTLREQRKDPFKCKLHKLLIKVLETKKVYVDMSTITNSYLNSLFVFLPYIYRCYILFTYFIVFLFSFYLPFFCRLYRRQLLYCCPPRIAPLIVDNIVLINYLIVE